MTAERAIDECIETARRMLNLRDARVPAARSELYARLTNDASELLLAAEAATQAELSDEQIDDLWQRAMAASRRLRRLREGARNRPELITDLKARL